MDLPRLCTVGAGKLSTRRIYPYIGAACAKLVGVCDLDTEKAAANAARWGGEVYTDLEKMLAERKPDGVIICTGATGHAALAPQVMRAGYPVYTEKPPAPTAAEALEVARASAETGRLCMTAFKKRYCDATSRARRFLDQFDESQWLSLSVDYASGGYTPDENGRSGFLFDFAIHTIDLVGYLFGDVAKVFCFEKPSGTYAVSLQFANGAVGVMNLTRGRSFMVPTEETEITVEGGNFMTIHNSSNWRITEDQKPCEWREPGTFISAGDSGNDTGHLAEIVAFVKAITDGEPVRSPIYESYKSMVLFEAIQQSADTGRVVELRYETVDQTPVTAVGKGS